MMVKTEVKAADGGDLSPIQEVKSAVADFTRDLKEFRADIHTRLQQQEERLTMLDRKSFAPARPALARSVDEGAPHQKAFDAYVRSGDDDALRGIELEGKAMHQITGADGGYLVDPQTSETVSSVLKSTVSIRQVANVVHIESSSYDALVDTSDVGAGWADETSPTAETGTPVFERINIPLHELSAMPKASQRLLDDAAFDVESWLAERIADKFARAENAAFLVGDGFGKPVGLLNNATVDNDSWAWGTLGTVPTGVDGGLGSGDAVIDLVYSLGARYRANATFVMNSKTAGEVRKLKDQDGRFLWTDGIGAGEPAHLLGYPVLVAEDMPDVAIGSLSIAFGDFGTGFTIVERPELRVLRDPFSAKPNVLFYASKRVGAGVTDYAAIKLLKFSAS